MNYHPTILIQGFYIYGELNVKSKEQIDKKEINYFKNKNKNLFFMDYLNDPLLKHHNDNSIFIIPSEYGEGLPRGIIEALSLKIPVIASNKSCVGLFDKKSIRGY